MRDAITSAGAAGAGPYSLAVQAGPLLFVSGQTSSDPLTGEFVQGDLSAQTAQALENLFSVLAAAGLTFDDVVHVTVRVVDRADIPEIDGTYEKWFSRPYPARTTVTVAALPMDARVEIELVALRP